MTAGIKLLLLAVSVTGLMLLSEPWQLAAALGAIMLLYGCAYFSTRFRPLTVLRQLLPLLVLLLVAVPIQILFLGWETAAVLSGRVLAIVLLATLVSITTSVTEILDTAQWALRPFRRVVDTDRVGLALALTIRCIPLLGDIARDVSNAARARGSGSLRALAVPMIIRALRQADQLGDALIARGVAE